jgi:uncharacterized repeat protein (TIGR03837 family)
MAVHPPRRTDWCAGFSIQALRHVLAGCCERPACPLCKRMSRRRLMPSGSAWVLPLTALLQGFADSPQPLRLLVPESIAPMVANALDLPVFTAGQQVQHGACELCVIPFLSQPDYDRLLSLCDVNFVRGEDSWVRAIWAGKPMVWLPYQQTDNTHLQKLEAFLRHYLALAKPAVATVVQDMMQAWASGRFESKHWTAFISHYSEVSRHSLLVASQLAQSSDLVTNMVIFIEKLQKNRV